MLLTRNVTTHVLSDKLSILDLKPAGTDDASLHHEEFELGCVGAKDMAEIAAGCIHW